MQWLCNVLFHLVDEENNTMINYAGLCVLLNLVDEECFTMINYAGLCNVLFHLV